MQKVTPADRTRPIRHRERIENYRENGWTRKPYGNRIVLRFREERGPWRIRPSPAAIIRFERYAMPAGSGLKDDIMTTEKKTTTTTIRHTVNGKKRIFPFVGAVLLMTCLFAGFVQAADNSNVPVDLGFQANANQENAGLVSGRDGFGPDSDKGCGEHQVNCLDKNLNLLGTIESGCYYQFSTWSCEFDVGDDLDRCIARYPRTEAIEARTECHW